MSTITVKNTVYTNLPADKVATVVKAATAVRAPQYRAPKHSIPRPGTYFHSVTVDTAVQACEAVGLEFWGFHPDSQTAWAVGSGIYWLVTYRHGVVAAYDSASRNITGPVRGGPATRTVRDWTPGPRATTAAATTPALFDMEVAA